MVSSPPKRSLSFSPDLGIALLWSVLMAFVVTLPVVRETPLRTLVAGPYLLVVPGYALVAVLFPSKGELSLFKRGVFSLGASIVVTLLWGVVLAGTPWGLTQITLLSEGVLIIGLTLAAEYRREVINQEYPQEQKDEKQTEMGSRFGDQNSPADPFASVTAALRQAWNHRNMVGGGNRVLQAAIVVAVLASVGATAYAIGTPLPSERYTELSVVGPNGTVDGIPSNASTGESVTLTIGIENHEYRKLTYGLQTKLSTAKEVRVVKSNIVKLARGETSTQTIQVGVPDEPGRVTVQILLFKGAPPVNPVNPEKAYRSIQISLSVDRESEETIVDFVRLEVDKQMIGAIGELNC